MIPFLLCDIAPDPVRTGISFTSLILVGVAVLILVAAVLTASCFWLDN